MRKNLSSLASVALGVFAGGFAVHSAGVYDAQDGWTEFRNQEVTIGAGFEEGCQINTTMGAIHTLLTDRQNPDFGVYMFAYPVECDRLKKEIKARGTCDNPETCG